MNENTVLIRKAEEKDYPFILRVNEENVEVLSPMDEAKLKGFAEFAEILLVAEVDNAPAAFLIGIREGIGCYDSENYLWFQKKYPQFLYVDRIVIDEPYRSAGIGKMLYQEVLHYACLTGVPMVTAEIDTIPYNETSLKFHERMGFQEVGVQFVRNNSIKVSLQAVAVDCHMEHVHGHFHSHRDEHAHVHNEEYDHAYRAGHDHVHSAGHGHTHPNAKAVSNRLAKAIGHLEKVKQMVDQEEDCAQVLVQLTAVRSAINNAGKIILSDHLNHCVVEAAEKGDYQKIEEFNEAVKQFVK